MTKGTRWVDVSRRRKDGAVWTTDEAAQAKQEFSDQLVRIDEDHPNSQAFADFVQHSEDEGERRVPPASGDHRR